MAFFVLSYDAGFHGSPRPRRPAAPSRFKALGRTVPPCALSPVCCVEQGYWAGPAVLLAPAISGLWNLAWPSFEPELPAAAAARVLVVQGDRDDTVPFERVVDLCRRKVLRLEVVEGGDHRLVGAMLGPTERLAQLVRDEYQSSAPSPMHLRATAPPHDGEGRRL